MKQDRLHAQKPKELRGVLILLIEMAFYLQPRFQVLRFMPIRAKYGMHAKPQLQFAVFFQTLMNKI